MAMASHTSTNTHTIQGSILSTSRRSATTMDAALEHFIQTFGLVPHHGDDDAATFRTTMPDAVPWFPLSNVTARYVYPDKDVEHVATIECMPNKRTTKP